MYVQYIRQANYAAIFIYMKWHENAYKYIRCVLKVMMTFQFMGLGGMKQI